MQSEYSRHLIIRADASSQTGTGHVMRCMALAQGWLERGGTVAFITFCESAALRQRLGDEGFEVIALEACHPHSSDLEMTLSICEARESWLVLDGYGFTPDYQRAIRDAGFGLLVMDDYNHHSVYHADILLNQNIGAEDIRYNCGSDTDQLLGCRFTMLRNEFFEYMNTPRSIAPKGKRILVTMGGADPNNASLRVLNALHLMEDPDLDVKIVVGPSNRHGLSLETSVGNALFKGEICCNVKNMPSLMAWADIAISAGGSTCWELAFMGLPSLIVILDDNQEAIAKELGSVGASDNLGWDSSIDEKKLAEQVRQLVFDPERRTIMSQKSKQLVDGTGVMRVIDAMGERGARSS